MKPAISPFVGTNVVYFLLPLLLSTAPEPTLLETHVVEAKVYRSGLVMLVREAMVPAGENSFRLRQIPQALEDTFWYDSPDHAEISDVRTSLEVKRLENSQDPATIAEYLRANVGKHIDFSVKNKDAIKKVSGVETSVDSTYNPKQPIVTVRLADDSIEEYNSSEFASLSTKGLTGKNLARGVKASLHMEFRTRAQKPSRIRFYSLETGAAWRVDYRVDLGEGKAKVTTRCVLALGGVSLKDSDVELVTGVPNLTGIDKLDLTTGESSLSHWLYQSAQSDFGTAPANPDPYQRLEAVIAFGRSNGYWYDPVSGYFRSSNQGTTQLQNISLSKANQGLVPDGIDFISYNPTDNSLITEQDRASLGFVKNAINAARVESVFSFPMGAITLEPGQRLTRILSTTENSATPLYQWNLTEYPNNSGDQGIRQLISVTNKSNSPWPDGVAFITKGSTPLAELQMPFTPIGKSAQLELAKTSDIPTEKSVKELKRELVSRADRPDGKLITYEETLSVSNTRSEAIATEINLSLLGRITEAKEAKVTETKELQNFDNPSSLATWKTRIQPGEKKEVKLIYKVII